MHVIVDIPQSIACPAAARRTSSATWPQPKSSASSLPPVPLASACPRVADVRNRLLELAYAR
jgi:hypothetical protein